MKSLVLSSSKKDLSAQDISLSVYVEEGIPVENAKEKNAFFHQSSRGADKASQGWPEGIR